MNPDFKKAYLKTMGHEGGYSDDPDDNGRETWKGISRRAHPDWPGWAIVDELRLMSEFPLNLHRNSKLQSLVDGFYIDTFWVPMGCDNMPQLIAEEVFDSGINTGQRTAVKFLQQALNSLNKNERYYNDLIVDGGFGKISHAALRIILQRGEDELLYKIMNVIQGAHYLSIMNDSLKQEKYTRGWFGRVEFVKHGV